MRNHDQRVGVVAECANRFCVFDSKLGVRPLAVEVLVGGQDLSENSELTLIGFLLSLLDVLERLLAFVSLNRVFFQVDCKNVDSFFVRRHGEVLAIAVERNRINLCAVRASAHLLQALLVERIENSNQRSFFGGSRHESARAVKRNCRQRSLMRLESVDVVLFVKNHSHRALIAVWGC